MEDGHVTFTRGGESDTTLHLFEKAIDAIVCEEREKALTEACRTGRFESDKQPEGTDLSNEALGRLQYELATGMDWPALNDARKAQHMKSAGAIRDAVLAAYKPAWQAKQQRVIELEAGLRGMNNKHEALKVTLANEQQHAKELQTKVEQQKGAHERVCEAAEAGGWDANKASLWQWIAEQGAKWRTDKGDPELLDEDKAAREAGWNGQGGMGDFIRGQARELNAAKQTRELEKPFFERLKELCVPANAKPGRLVLGCVCEYIEQLRMEYREVAAALRHAAAIAHINPPKPFDGPSCIISALSQRIREQEQQVKKAIEAAGNGTFGPLERKVHKLIAENWRHKRNGVQLAAATWKDIFDHLRSEVDEAEDSIKAQRLPHSEGTLGELGDCLGLIVHAIIRAGGTVAQVEALELAKLDERCERPQPADPAITIPATSSNIAKPSGYYELGWGVDGGERYLFVSKGTAIFSRCSWPEGETDNRRIEIMKDLVEHANLGLKLKDGRRAVGKFAILGEALELIEREHKPKPGNL